MSHCNGCHGTGAGGAPAVSVLAAFEWCVVLGCLAGATTLALLAGRGSKVAPVPITVRGPATYAGPGSLGGTKSAIRR